MWVLLPLFYLHPSLLACRLRLAGGKARGQARLQVRSLPHYICTRSGLGVVKVVPAKCDSVLLEGPPCKLSYMRCMLSWLLLFCLTRVGGCCGEGERVAHAEGAIARVVVGGCCRCLRRLWWWYRPSTRSSSILSGGLQTKHKTRHGASRRSPRPWRPASLLP